MSRAFLFVMDSVGIGGAADAAEFGDAGADTVGHIAEICAAGGAEGGRAGPLRLPTLSALGLGAAAELATGRRPPGLGAPRPGAVWAAAEPRSAGKDTITGHWELAGVPLTEPWAYFPREVPAFPDWLTDALAAASGAPGFLGLRHASGQAILEELGAESVATGRPILYTSADSVLQIAAHEHAFGLARLEALCRDARRILDEAGLRVGRVISRPFVGERGAFRRTANRHDFAVPPPAPTLCDRVAEAGGRTVSVGKIADIFAGRGIAEGRRAPDDLALLAEARAAMDAAGPGDLVFANFVDFDSLYGHRRDPPGYARALEAFDAALPTALEALGPGDLMIVTADHGNDPTWTGTDHTRERTPVLAAGPGLAGGDAGLVDFADVGETLAAHLGLPPGGAGTPFLEVGLDGRLGPVRRRP